VQRRPRALVEVRARGVPGGLGRAPAGSGQGDDIEPFGHERQAETGRQLGAERLVLIGGFAAEAVVQVDQPTRRAPTCGSVSWSRSVSATESGPPDSATTTVVGPASRRFRSRSAARGERSHELSFLTDDGVR